MKLQDTISIFSLLAAFIAIIISIKSYRDNQNLAEEGFNRNYRPYICAANFAYIDQRDGKYYSDMNILFIKLYNAPALIKSKKLSFFIRDSENDSLLFTHPEYTNELAYPIDNNQITIDTDREIISHELALKISPKKLIRKVSIEYTWISKGKETYFFNLESEYDTLRRDWSPIKQSAN